MSQRVAPETLILWAQFLLTGTLFLGFFAVLALVTLGRAEMPDEQVRLMDTLCGVLGTLCTQAAAYWFARQRSSTQGAAA
jgi:hypothetical protein